MKTGIGEIQAEKVNGLDPEKWVLNYPDELISLEKWQKTVNLLAKLFKAPAGFLVQYTKSGFQVTIASEQDSNPYGAGTIIEPEANIFCRKIVETRSDLYVKNAPIDPCWDTNPEVHDDGFVSYLGVPVFWPDGQPFGTFCVMDYKETDYQEDLLNLIRHLKDILESDLSMIDMYYHAQQLAITDSLTNINNRRGFKLLAKQRMNLARRIPSALGIFYCDVNEFKSINDRFGHAIGDEALRAIGEALLISTRNSDILGRIGGDEFVALVNLQSHEDSEKAISRFESNLEKLIIEKNLPSFACTFGYAKVENNMSIEELLKLADQDMLAHKKSG